MKSFFQRFHDSQPGTAKSRTSKPEKERAKAALANNAEPNLPPSSKRHFTRTATTTTTTTTPHQHSSLSPYVDYLGRATTDYSTRFSTVPASASRHPQQKQNAQHDASPLPPTSPQQQNTPSSLAPKASPSAPPDNVKPEHKTMPKRLDVRGLSEDEKDPTTRVKTNRPIASVPSSNAQPVPPQHQVWLPPPELTSSKDKGKRKERPAYVGETDGGEALHDKPQDHNGTTDYVDRNKGKRPKYLTDNEVQAQRIQDSNDKERRRVRERQRDQFRETEVRKQPATANDYYELREKEWRERERLMKEKWEREKERERQERAQRDKGQKESEGRAIEPKDKHQREREQTAKERWEQEKRERERREGRRKDLQFSEKEQPERDRRDMDGRARRRREKESDVEQKEKVLKEREPLERRPGESEQGERDRRRLERLQREREYQEKERARIEREQQDRERMRLERERLERERLEKEQREKEKERKEKERREREQRERERRERERQEREQWEREQREKEQRERELRERERREREYQELRERELRELREKELREREQHEREQREREQREREVQTKERLEMEQREKEKEKRKEKEQQERNRRERERELERVQKEKEERERREREKERKEKEREEWERERREKEREERERTKREVEREERKERRERGNQEGERKNREREEEFPQGKDAEQKYKEPRAVDLKDELRNDPSSRDMELLRIGREREEKRARERAQWEREREDRDRRNRERARESRLLDRRVKDYRSKNHSSTEDVLVESDKEKARTPPGKYQHHPSLVPVQERDSYYPTQQQRNNKPQLPDSRSEKVNERTYRGEVSSPDLTEKHQRTHSSQDDYVRQSARRVSLVAYQEPVSNSGDATQVENAKMSSAAIRPVIPSSTSAFIQESRSDLYPTSRSISQSKGSPGTVKLPFTQDNPDRRNNAVSFGLPSGMASREEAAPHHHTLTSSAADVNVSRVSPRNLSDRNLESSHPKTYAHITPDSNQRFPLQESTPPLLNVHLQSAIPSQATQSRIPTSAGLETTRKYEPKQASAQQFHDVKHDYKRPSLQQEQATPNLSQNSGKGTSQTHPLPHYEQRSTPVEVSSATPPSAGNHDPRLLQPVHPDRSRTSTKDSAKVSILVSHFEQIDEAVKNGNTIVRPGTTPLLGFTDQPIPTSSKTSARARNSQYVAYPNLERPSTALGTHDIPKNMSDASGHHVQNVLGPTESIHKRYHTTDGPSPDVLPLLPSVQPQQVPGNQYSSSKPSRTTSGSPNTISSSMPVAYTQPVDRHGLVKSSSADPNSRQIPRDEKSSSVHQPAAKWAGARSSPDQVYEEKMRAEPSPTYGHHPYLAQNVKHESSINQPNPGNLHLHAQTHPSSREGNSGTVNAAPGNTTVPSSQRESGTLKAPVLNEDTFIRVTDSRQQNHRGSALNPLSSSDIALDVRQSQSLPYTAHTPPQPVHPIVQKRSTDYTAIKSRDRSTQNSHSPEYQKTSPLASTDAASLSPQRTGNSSHSKLEEEYSSRSQKAQGQAPQERLKELLSPPLSKEKRQLPQSYLQDARRNLKTKLVQQSDSSPSASHGVASVPSESLFNPRGSSRAEYSPNQSKGHPSPSGRSNTSSPHDHNQDIDSKGLYHSQTSTSTKQTPSPRDGSTLIVEGSPPTGPVSVSQKSSRHAPPVQHLPSKYEKDYDTRLNTYQPSHATLNDTRLRNDDTTRIMNTIPSHSIPLASHDSQTTRPSAPQRESQRTDPSHIPSRASVSHIRTRSEPHISQGTSYARSHQSSSTSHRDGIEHVTQSGPRVSATQSIPVTLATNASSTPHAHPVQPYAQSTHQQQSSVSRDGGSSHVHHSHRDQSNSVRPPLSRSESMPSETRAQHPSRFPEQLPSQPQPTTPRSYDIWLPPVPRQQEELPSQPAPKPSAHHRERSGRQEHAAAQKRPPSGAPQPPPANIPSERDIDLSRAFSLIRTRKLHTMSQVSMEAQDGTASTVVASPTNSILGQIPINIPPVQDPIEAARQWSQEGARVRGKKILRPGLVWENPEDPPLLEHRRPERSKSSRQRRSSRSRETSDTD